MPPKSKKRKLDANVERCILHASGIQHKEFTSFNNVKGSPGEKLAYLLDIRKKRLNEPHDSPYRMDDICSLIPESLGNVNIEEVGYHRGCYQNFTKNLDRLRSDTSTVENTKLTRSPQKPSASKDPGKFPTKCIFCEKQTTRKSHGKKEQCVTFAVFKDFFNLRHINHLRDTNSKKEGPPTEQEQKTLAHQKVLDVVIDYIQESVIAQEEVVELRALGLLYVKELDKNGFPSPDDRSENLKVKLEKHEIGELIEFTKVNPGDYKNCIMLTLVYNAGINRADAVAHAYKLGTIDRYQDVALLLRQAIYNAFKESEPLPWPPTAEDLNVNSLDEALPPELKTFLNYVVSGDAKMDKGDKMKRIVLSIGQVIICFLVYVNLISLTFSFPCTKMRSHYIQDICRAATNGEWKLPKHILLCTTVRHLYRSKLLTIILARLGHCETYDFGLELETAIAKALDEVSTTLTPQIIKGKVTRCFTLSGTT